MSGRIRAPLALAALIAVVFLTPRPTSRPAAVIPSGVRTAETDQQRTGVPVLSAPSAAATFPVVATAVTIDPATARNPALTPPDTGSVTGTATWYCRPGISRCTAGYPFGMYGAAGPEVRAMLGPDWRGRFVIVTDRTGIARVVQLIDWCLCGGDHVIDLYWDVFEGIHNPVVITEEP